MTGSDFVTAIHALPEDGDELRIFSKPSGEGVRILVVKRSNYPVYEFSGFHWRLSWHVRRVRTSDPTLQPAGSIRVRAATSELAALALAAAVQTWSQETGTAAPDLTRTVIR